MRKFQVATFEDYAYENFLPMTHTRPAFDLRCGASTFRSRIENLFSGSELLLFSREHLAGYIESKEKRYVNRSERIFNTTLFLNGLLILGRELVSRISNAPEGQVGVKDGRLVYACLNASKARELAQRLSKPLSNLDVSQIERTASSKVEVRDAQILTYPWEIIRLNDGIIKHDLASMKKSRAGKVHARAAIIGRRVDLSIGPGSIIEPGVVVDTRSGPVYIAPNTIIHANSWIQGPSYIGSETQIFPLTRIHGGSSIGNSCTIGGEIEKTIIHDYSKVHAGLLGYSYIGEWVDLGAMTTISDSKDGYGTVDVNVGGQKVDTGETRVGIFVGDYVRTSACTTISAGKKIGVASQIRGTVAEDVPSFSTYDKTTSGKPMETTFESIVETQRRMFNVKKVEYTAAHITLLKRVYDLTWEERRAAGMAQMRPTT